MSTTVPSGHAPIGENPVRRKNHFEKFWYYYLIILVTLLLGLFVSWLFLIVTVGCCIGLPIHAIQDAKKERESGVTPLATTTPLASTNSIPPPTISATTGVVDVEKGLGSTTKKKRSVIAVVNKASVDEKLGIKVQHSYDGRYLVGPLAPDSPFQKTALKEGMEIKSINSVPLQGHDMASVMTILKNSMGSIIVVAETDEEPTPAIPSPAPAPVAPVAAPSTKNNTKVRTIAAVVNKATAEEKLGIQLFKNGDGEFLVSKVNPESPFQNTELEEGMKVKSINGVELENKDMAFAMSILKGAVGTIIVAAEKEEDTSPPTASAPQPYVQAPPAPAPATAQYMRQESNGLDSRKTASATAPGHVAEGQGAVSTVTAVVNKANADQKLGISLNRTPDGDFIIAELAPDSPFNVMGLAVGMKVLNINGIALTGQPFALAVTLLKDMSGEVRVTAESSPVHAAAPAQAVVDDDDEDGDQYEC